MAGGPSGDSEPRSLDRPPPASIFTPLDADEPIPREQVVASRRLRPAGRWELAGAAWLPILVVIPTVGGWAGVPPVILVGALVLSFAGLLGYAIAGDRHKRRH